MADVPHARLTLRRSGGLAGLTMEGELDTRELPADQAQAVLDALERADLAAGTAPAPPASALGADRFQYELTVQRGDATHVAAFSEAQMPTGLAPVVRAVMARAAPAAGR